MQGGSTLLQMWYHGDLPSSKVLCALDAGWMVGFWKGWKDAGAAKPGRTQPCPFAGRQLKPSYLGMELLEQNQTVQGKGRDRQERKKEDKNTQPWREMGWGLPA